MSKKSTAKANGLKSTFKIGEGQYFMTSFGKGNTAQEEKDIKGKEVTDLRKTFSAEVQDGNSASISGAVGTVSVQLPHKDNNLLQAKSVIEQMFFDKAFSDNIHIQIAYNVMDIKKLLAVYANNIIYTVNNLLRVDSDKDFLGVFGTMNEFKASQIAYSVLQTKLIQEVPKNQPCYTYYKDGKVIQDKYKRPNGAYNLNMRVLYDKTKRKKLFSLLNLAGYNPKDRKYIPSVISNCLQNDLHFEEYGHIVSTAKNYQRVMRYPEFFSYILQDGNIRIEYLYECVRLLGNMRQTAFHSDDLKNEDDRIQNTYTLFELDSKAQQGTKDILDAITKSKIDNINNSFISTSTVNLNILFACYPKTDKNEIIKEYYDFSVRKVYKNMGFSVKALRETILDTNDDVKGLREDKYNSVRPKLHSLIDFVIYNFYLQNEDKANAFVALLRQVKPTAAEEKDGITIDDKKLELYKKEASELWLSIKNVVKTEIIPGIEKCKSSEDMKALKENEIDESLKNEINSVVEKSESLSYFSKAIYCICAFLDGKEINMFLDSLINSFDNIASLIKVAEYINVDVEFAENYSFFNNCAEKANELRFIKSIARMNKSKKATADSLLKKNGFQYYDAAAIFGETNKDRITALFKLDKVSTKEHKVDHTLRNFFINNVINSSRYNYVIRFVNPANARRLMQSKALVSFAISDINDKQIIRYCKSTKIPYNANNPDLKEMRSALTEKLLRVDFNTFAKVSNNKREAEEKERLKALVGLYLTIIYLITKSLVRINTSYSIAFSIFERDCMILDKKAALEPDENSCLIKNISFEHYRKTKIDSNYFGVTEYFINNGKINDRTKNLVIRNKNHYNNGTFRWFRNNVEHLAVVSHLPEYVDEIKRVESYFDLYHYIMLRCLKDRGAIKCSETNEFFEEVNGRAVPKYQSAYKNFLYGILVPFAYNPARYINLACKNKFIEGYGK